MYPGLGQYWGSVDEYIADPRPPWARPGPITALERDRYLPPRPIILTAAQYADTKATIDRERRIYQSAGRPIPEHFALYAGTYDEYVAELERRWRAAVERQMRGAETQITEVRPPAPPPAPGPPPGAAPRPGPPAPGPAPGGPAPAEEKIEIEIPVLWLAIIAAALWFILRR